MNNERIKGELINYKDNIFTQCNKMERLILLLLIALPELIFGQQTQSIANHSQYLNDSINSKPIARNAHSKKPDISSDSVAVNGHYTSNKQDSILSVFDEKGKLEQLFNITRNELIYYKSKGASDNKKYRVLFEGKIIDTMLERPPIYIGGQTLLSNEIVKNLNYPELASQNNISGNVLISFIIDKSGKACNHFVKQGIGYGCDEEALKVVKNIPNTWLAGILNGHAVDVELTLSVNFSVQVIELGGE